MPQLVSPSEAYQDSYLEAIRELQAEGRHPDLDVTQLAADFAGHVAMLLRRADPAYVAPGLVPDTVLWLVNGDEYIGRAAVRHWLNERLLEAGGHIGYEIRPSKRRRGYGKLILRLALEHARALGLWRVLVTCDEDNLGSKRIIEANGGQFENAVEQPGETVRKLRYWIDT